MLSLPPETFNVLSFVMGAIIGSVGGFITRGVVDKKLQLIQAKDLVMLSVVSLFIISMLIDFISPNYETSPFLYGLMGAIVGFFYRPVNNGKEQ